MNTEEQLLDEMLLVSVTELSASSGLSAEDVHELVELGVFAPRTHEPALLFAAHCIELARAAHRLRTDFDLSLGAVALVLTYRERIRELEAQLHRLECELPGRSPPA